MRCIFLPIGGPGGAILPELREPDGFLRLLLWLGRFLELEDDRFGGLPFDPSPPGGGPGGYSSEPLELRELPDVERLELLVLELFVLFATDRFVVEVLVDVDVLPDVDRSPFGGSPGPSPFSAPHGGGIPGPFVVIGVPYLFKAETSEEIRAFLV